MNDYNSPYNSSPNISGVFGLVFGLIGILTSFLSAFLPIGLISLIASILGIILGGIGVGKARVSRRGGGMATAGLVLGIIGTIFAFIGLSCGVCVYGIDPNMYSCSDFPRYFNGFPA